MGCDIHLYIEKRNGFGQWKAAGDFQRDEPEDDQSKGWISGDSYCDRNYDLFAILADVRNGYGFAGCKTGEGFVPIASPRGIPDDASDIVKEISEQWGIDGHSHSFHTLRQILDYDWTQTTGLQGWANAVSWAKWSRWQRENGGAPDSYCAGVSGPNIRHVTADEMDKLLEPVKNEYSGKREEFAKQHSDVYALAHWTVCYADAAGSFFTRTIPELLKLAGGATALDDVRIVFFFDN